ncbi:MAG: phage tail tape measure protein [Rhodocyclaceae bacterium]|nr:MAG: phage tail tape measure protein [Rhodocyclaceae bacterium]
MTNSAEFGLRLKVDTGESQKFTGVVSDMGKVTQAAQQTSAALGTTTDEVQKLLDKYDPLGAKLRQLKTDFNALSNAARTGNVGLGDDNRFDLTMSRMLAQMKELESGGKSATTEVVKGFTDVAANAEKGMFATAGARRELMVLGHEAMTGNFSRMPGSFMVLAERMSLTEALMAPTTLGIIGLGVAAAGAAVEIVRGSMELEHFSKTMQLTGGYSGQTRDSINAMAEDIRTNVSGGVVKARELLEAFAASGRFTSNEIAAVGRAAIDFQHLTEESASNVVKAFEGMTEGTVKWAETTNAQYHYLNVVQYEHIRQLVEHGNKEQAIIEISGALHKSLDAQAEKVGLLKMSYLGWGMAIDKVANSLMNIGKGPTIAEERDSSIAREADLRKRLESARNLPLGGMSSQLEAELKAQHALSMKLIEQANSEELAAYQKAIDAKTQQHAIEAAATLDGIKKNVRTRAQIRADEAEKIREDAEAVNAGAIAAGKQRVYSEEQIQQLIQQSAQKYRDAANRSEISAAKATLDEKAKLIDDAAKAEQSALKRNVTLHLMTDQDAARKSLEIETNRVQEREKILAQEYQNALKANDKKGQVTALGEMQRLAQGLGEYSGKENDQVKIDAQKVEQANIRIGFSIDVLKGKFNEQNEAVERSFQILPEGQRKLEDALAKVNQEGKKLTDDLKKQYDEKIIDEQTYTARLADANKVIADQRQEVGQLNEKQMALNDSWWYGSEVALQKYLDNIQNVSAQGQRFMTSMLSSAENAWVKWATTGKISIKDLFNTLAQEVAKAEYNKLFAPLAASGMSWASNSLNNALGLGTSYNPNSAAAGMVESADSLSFLSAFGYAKGDVFSSPSLHRYANTILSSPTLFKFAQGGAFGMAGEAGPEAVMPLVRGPGGSLGVKVYPEGAAHSSGTSGSVVVNVIESPGNGGQVSQRQDNGRTVIDVVVEKVKSSIASDISLGRGPVSAAIEHTYGGNRAAGAY